MPPFQGARKHGRSFFQTAEGPSPYEDTVEFFNLVTGVKLNEREKTDLVAFMRQL
jgi:hypothetical protein